MSQLLDIGLRRVGADRVHRARVPSDVLYDSSLLGQPVIGVHGPIVARCGAKLRGRMIQIPDEYLALASQDKWQCPMCLMVLRHDYTPRLYSTPDLQQAEDLGGEQSSPCGGES